MFSAKGYFHCHIILMWFPCPQLQVQVRKKFQVLLQEEVKEEEGLWAGQNRPFPLRIRAAPLGTPPCDALSEWSEPHSQIRGKR